MAHKADENKILTCRNCSYTVYETTDICPNCGISAPGIYSQCPNCNSKYYIWKPYGINKSAALGGLIIGGPIGSVIGVDLGSNDTECICSNCGQGWMPFAFPGGKWSITRKHALKRQ